MSETTTRPREMLDRYELIALLARGGMGAVHLARLPGVGGFQRLFAIKRMHPHLAEEAEFVEMLLDEARIAARLHHPNAVPIVDVCPSESGLYLVMDYIDGVTLAKILTATPLALWKERVSVALRVLCDSLAGLHAAHELHDDEGHSLSLVHRDVSPQNILVGTDGVGRITDFGIALAASRIAASRPGMIKGKPSYMAPEQVSAGAVDRRVDVFAIGIILWEALANARLFHADSEMGALMQVITAPIDAPSSRVREVSPALDAVCLKALQREVGQRYETARTMAEALEKAARADGLLASSNEVADFLQRHFADDIAKRRTLIREHVRATGNTSLAPVRGKDGEVSLSGLSRPVMAAPPGASASDSKSIPAIEVPSKSMASVKPPPVSIPGDPPAPKSSRSLAMAAVGVSLVAVVAIGFAVTHKAPTPARPPVAASPVVAAPEPSPAPQPVIVPTPAPAPVALQDAAVAVADVPAARPVTPPPVAAAVVVPTRRPRRPETPPGEAPAAPAEPAIESNPYLRR